MPFTAISTIPTNLIAQVQKIDDYFQSVVDQITNSPKYTPPGNKYKTESPYSSTSTTNQAIIDGTWSSFNITQDVFIPDSLSASVGTSSDPSQYDELINHVGATNYEYWATLKDFLQQKNFNLLNFVSTFGTDSNDPYFGASKGLNIGQTLGRFFQTSIPGFYNSQRSNPVPSLLGSITSDTEIQNIYNALGFQTLGLVNGEPYEDRISWYLDDTNPAQYTVDERLRNGWRKNPVAKDILSVLSNTVGDTLTKNVVKASQILNAVNNFTQTAESIVNAGANLIGLSDGIVPNANLLPTPSQVGTFLNQNLPNSILASSGSDTWDLTVDTILSGKVDQYAPLIPVEFFRDWISNPNTPGNVSKWFNFDKDQQIEQVASNFITNFAIDNYNRQDYPNIKNSQDQNILAVKTANVQNSQHIFEGVQQVDGSYDNVLYNDPTSPFEPQNGQADTFTSEYLSNVDFYDIQTVLNEQTDSPRIYNNVSPNDMANQEPQYFVFYIRSLNREDHALIQQPFEDNGMVFMSKRKYIGSSIVFLAPSINNITEGFNNTVNQEQFLGRTEPILSYGGTQRTFGISFNIPIARPEDMPVCRQKVLEIIRMAYPQLLAIKETGTLGFRRNPMIEMRIGDMYLIKGIIGSLNLEWGQDSKTWELVPGGRALRGCKIDLTLNVVHSEQPGAQTDFYSPTFRPEVFLTSDEYINTTQYNTNQFNSNDPNGNGANSLSNINQSLPNISLPSLPNLNPFKGALLQQLL